MDAAEFIEWIAFESIDLDDSWYQSAALRLQLARIMGDKRTRFEDLIPRRRKARPKGGILAAMAAWADACGAKFKRPEPEPAR